MATLIMLQSPPGAAASRLPVTANGPRAAIYGVEVFASARALVRELVERPTTRTSSIEI